MSFLSKLQNWSLCSMLLNYSPSAAGIDCGVKSAALSEQIVGDELEFSAETKQTQVTVGGGEAKEASSWAELSKVEEPG